MKTKITAFILALLMCLSLLTGCGSASAVPGRGESIRQLQAPKRLAVPEKEDPHSENGWLNTDGAEGSEDSFGPNSENFTSAGNRPKDTDAAAAQTESGRAPGISLLDALSAKITYPKSDSWLDSLSVRYLKSAQGTGAYLFSRTPDVVNYVDYGTAVIPDGTRVILTAEEAGAGCVVTENGEIGWVDMDLLQPKPELTGSVRMDIADSFGSGAAGYDVKEAVCGDSYEHVTGLADGKGRVSFLYPSDRIYKDPVYEKAKNWTDVRELELGYGVIAGISYDGRLLVSSEGGYYETELSPLDGRTDVVDISVSSYTDLAVTCAGGEIYFAAVLAGDVPPLTVPGARQAVIAFSTLYVLSYTGEVMQYEYSCDTGEWTYLGVAAKGVKELESADYNKNYAAAALMRDGRVALLGCEYGNNAFAEGFEDITDIAVGALLIGCDSEGYVYIYGGSEWVNNTAAALADWGRVKSVFAGNYELFGLE